jgi:hypothetical protein
MDLEELYNKLSDYLKIYDNDFFENVFLKFDKIYNEKIISELKQRLTKFSEFKALTTFFYKDFQINDNIKNLLVNPKMKIENIDFAKK